MRFGCRSINKEGNADEGGNVGCVGASPDVSAATLHSVSDISRARLIGDVAAIKAMRFAVLSRPLARFHREDKPTNLEF